MKTKHLLCGAALLCLLTACNTPPAVKELSRQYGQVSSALAEAYGRDLRAAAGFVTNAQEGLNQLAAHARHRQELLEDALQLATNERIQAHRRWLLGEFDRHAFRAVTEAWEKEAETRFRLPLEAYRQRLKGVELAKREAFLRDRANVRAAEEYGRAALAHAKFLVLMHEAEADLRRELATKYDQARNEFIAWLDANGLAVPTNPPSGPTFEGLVAKIKQGPAPVAAFNFTTNLAAISQRELDVQAFQNDASAAWQRVDYYLQTHGYRTVLIRSFFTGLAAPFRDQLAKLKDKVAGSVVLPAAVKDFFAETVGTWDKAIERTVDSSGNLIEKGLDWINRKGDALVRAATESASKRALNVMETFDKELPARPGSTPQPPTP
jgi:hypothetical protein